MASTFPHSFDNSSAVPNIVRGLLGLRLFIIAPGILSSGPCA